MSSKEGDKKYESKFAIHFAVSNNDRELLLQILSKSESKRNINIPDLDGETPLHMAAFYGFIDILSTLLSSGANSSPMNAKSLTPLHYAAFTGNLDVAECLVKAGADLKAVDTEGDTPLHKASFVGNYEIVKLLLDSGAPISVPDINGQIPLHKASFRGHLEICSLLLQSKEVSNNKEKKKSVSFKGVDVLDKLGNTPLYLSSLYGKHECVRLFIKEGANIKHQNGVGMTCLHVASYEGHLETCKVLIELGSEIDVRDFDGKSIPEWAQVEETTEDDLKLLASEQDDQPKNRGRKMYGFTALHGASWFGHSEIVQLLVDNNADVHILGPNLHTALHGATLSGHLECIKILCTTSAILNSLADSDGSTPLHFASFKGYQDIVQYLVDSGAPILKKDKSGGTPIHYASYSGSKEILKILLKDQNPKVLDERDFDGATPLQHASMNGHKVVVDFLIKNGVDLYARDVEGASALQKAVFYDQLECVKLLLKASGRHLTDFVNEPDHNGMTCLHAASCNGSLKCFKHLVEKCSANIEQVDNDGTSCLHQACYRGQVEILKYLISKNCNLETKDYYGSTALHKIAYEPGTKQLECAKIILKNKVLPLEERDDEGQTALLVAVNSNNKEFVSFLLSKGSSPLCLDNDGVTPIHLAAYKGFQEIISLLLKKGRVPIDFTDRDGDTALHKASFSGKEKCISYLLKKKANVNSKNQEGNTPLHFASYQGRTKCVKLLLDNGADIDSLTCGELTPIQCAIYNGHVSTTQLLLQKGCNLNLSTTMGTTPLHSAAVRGNKKIVELLLSSGGQGLIEERDEEGNTPLLLAAVNSHIDILKLLVEVGEASVLSKNNKGATALHFSLYSRSHGCTKYLIEKGADLNAQYPGGLDYTPLHIAVQKGDLHGIKCLTSKGCDVNIQNRLGQTGLHLAVLQQNTQCCSSLIRSGADESIKDQNDMTPLDYAHKSKNKKLISIFTSTDRSVEIIEPDSPRSSESIIIDEKNSSALQNEILINSDGSSSSGLVVSGRKRTMANKGMSVTRSSSWLKGVSVPKITRLVRMAGIYKELLNPAEDFLKIVIAPQYVFVKVLIDTLPVTEADRIANSLVTLFYVMGDLMPLLKWAITNEVENTKEVNTLFRQNSIATKMMTVYARKVGSQFVEKTLKNAIQSVISSPFSFEVDPARLAEGVSLNQNIENFQAVTGNFFVKIIGSREFLPVELRELNVHLRTEVEKAFPGHSSAFIGGFMFLRVFCPAICAPVDNHLCEPSDMNPTVQRGLVLVSKVLQNLSNGVELGKKEPYMACMNPFIQKNLPLVQQFCEDISTSAPEGAQRIRLDSYNFSEDQVEKAFRNLHIHVLNFQEKISEPLPPEIAAQLATTLLELGDVRAGHRKPSAAPDRSRRVTTVLSKNKIDDLKKVKDEGIKTVGFAAKFQEMLGVDWNSYSIFQEK